MIVGLSDKTLHGAIGRTFGNAGCQFDSVGGVPLSAQQRRIIADIQRQEAYQGCR